METIQDPKKVKAKKAHTCNFCEQFINKGQIYYDSVYKQEEIYHWKVHVWCLKIATQLKMIEKVDEGISTDDFREFIEMKYQSLISESEPELYENSMFLIPHFNEQLHHVLNAYKIDYETI